MKAFIESILPRNSLLYINHLAEQRLNFPKATDTEEDKRIIQRLYAAKRLDDAHVVCHKWLGAWHLQRMNDIHEFHNRSMTDQRHKLLNPMDEAN